MSTIFSSMNSDEITEITDLNSGQFGYLQKLSKPSNALYNFILFAVLAILASLPFVTVDITTSSLASIQTNNLPETLYSPMPGKITSLRVANNRPIKRGDTLLTIDNAQLKEEIALTEARKALAKQTLHDIGVLRNIPKSQGGAVLYTTEYQTQLAHYVEQRALLAARLDNATKTYTRYTRLYAQKVIAASEYEKYELDYNQAMRDLKVHDTNARAQWQTAKYGLQQEFNNLATKENELRSLIAKSTVVANTAGTGYKAEGIQNGTYVQGGQKIAEIIPNSNLIAICLVSPRDIGFIRPNQRVRLQIDAYNYSDWGVLNASVEEIITDVKIVDNRPYYLVHCKLDKTHLTLKSGYTGTIIKGMTARANFTLTTKTLWQLLFTKLNDWLDPKQH